MRAGGRHRRRVGRRAAGAAGRAAGAGRDPDARAQQRRHVRLARRLRRRALRARLQTPPVAHSANGVAHHCVRHRPYFLPALRCRHHAFARLRLSQIVTEDSTSDCQFAACMSLAAQFHTLPAFSSALVVTTVSTQQQWWR